MPNLNLTHSGNMNITSASIGSGGTLNVQYEQNNTGYVTGYTVTPELTEVVCGQTYDLTFYPKFSGTVLTETFTVSGVDESGVRRSDSSVLRQGFDTDYRHYYDTWGYVPSYAFPDYVNSFSDRVEVRIPITGGVGNNARLTLHCQAGKGDNYVWQVPIVAPGPGPDTGSTLDELTIVVDDSITGTGVASAVYSPSTAQVELVYSSSDNSIAMIDPETGAIAVRQSGRVRFCVQDTITSRSACKYVDVYATPGGEVTAVYQGAEAGVNRMVVYNVCDNVEFVIFPDGSVWTNDECLGGEDLYYTFPESNTGRTLFMKTTDMTTPGFNVIPTLTELYLPTGYELENPYGNSVWFSGLQHISLPSDLETIPELFFGGVPMQSITIPSSVTTIGYGAFENCTGLTGITLPGVVTLGSFGDTPGVFVGCSSLTYANLPDTLQTIGSATFQFCSSLTEISIPSGVTDIGSAAFRGCSGLTAMTIEALTPPAISQNPDSTLNWSLGDPNYTFPIYVPCESLNAYKTAYPQYAHRIFCSGQEQTYASSIQLVISTPVLDSGTATVVPTPSTATVFPVYSSSNPDIATIDPFTGEITVHRSGDVIITVTDAYTNISTDETISVIALPDDVEVTYLIESTGATDLGRYNSSSLGVTRVYLEDGTTIFSGSSLPDSNKLTHTFTETGYTKVYFTFSSDTVNFRTKLPDSAKSVAFPNGTKSIRFNNSGQYNNGIESIIIPKTVKTVDCYRCTKLQRMTLYDTITSINFQGCSSLEEITVPSAITQILEGTFSGCTSLTAVTIPSSVTYLWQYSFDGCSSLETITFPSSLRTIGKNAFIYCRALKTIYAYPTTAPTCVEDGYGYPCSFENSGTNGTLYYPSGSDYSSWLENSRYRLGYYGWTGSPTL